MTKSELRQIQRIATITSSTEESLIYFRSKGIDWMLLDVTKQFTKRLILYRKESDNKYIQVREFQRLGQMFRYIKTQ